MTSEIGKVNVCGNVQGSFSSTWIIKNFSSLDSKVGTRYYSKKFQLENKGISWFLSICPGGETKDCEGHVSCFAHKSVDKNEIDFKFNFKFNISLLNTESEVLFGSKNGEWNTSCKGSGFSKTIDRDLLMTKLVDDTLIINIEVTHCLTSATSDDGVDHWVETTPIINLTEDFLKLWTSKENTDAVIKVGESDIPVHSLVLCARSKVFAATFKRDTKGSKTDRVNIKDFEKLAVDALMEFIYSGNVRRLSFDLAVELLRASHKYEVNGLKLYCSNYLISSMDNENVYEILLHADICEADKLRKQAMAYIVKNVTKDDFEAHRYLLKTRPELICDIVEALIEHKK